MSCESRSYDFFAIPPAGMDLDSAAALANTIIEQKNAEDDRNCDLGGDGRDDGLCVESSIKAALKTGGFQLDDVVVKRTNQWGGD